MTHSEFNHLLSSIKALSPAQMQRLRRQLDSELSHQKPPAAAPKKPAARTPARKAKRAEPRLTIDELHRQMMAEGLITRLPDPALDADDDDPDDAPVVIQGEPLSETILRERR